MKHLEFLNLTCSYSGSALSALAPQHFSALTSSSQLRTLSVHDEDLVLPAGAISHLFPAGRVLPQLEHLGLAGEWLDVNTSVSAADLQLMLDGCPRLNSLELRHMLQPGALAPLLANHQCTWLSVGGVAVDGDAASGVLCKLKHLQCLTIWEASTLTDRGLESLVALTALSRLDVFNCTGLSLEVYGPYAEEDGWNSLSLPHQDPPEAPVWQQLREACDRSPELAVRRVQELRQQVAELERRNGELEQRNSELEEQLAQQERS